MSAPRWRTEGHIKRPQLVQALNRRLPGFSQKAPFWRRWIASLTHAEVEVRPLKLTSAYFGFPPWLISYALSDTTNRLKEGRTSWDRSLILPL